VRELAASSRTLPLFAGTYLAGFCMAPGCLQTSSGSWTPSPLSITWTSILSESVTAARSVSRGALVVPQRPR
jgi:hypothetical protein